MSLTEEAVKKFVVDSRLYFGLHPSPATGTSPKVLAGSPGRPSSPPHAGAFHPHLCAQARKLFDSCDAR